MWEPHLLMHGVYRERGEKSATHIKYNLVDLIKMIHVKSQRVKTHEVLLFKAANVLFVHFA